MSSFSNSNDVRVGIVDDSPLIRKMIETVVNETEGLSVVGMAADPYEARQMIKDVNPDVITLDVEMPRMDGIAFLEKIMTLRPMPVIMVSTLTQKGADITLQALEIGALDYIAKPTKGSTGQDILSVFRDALIPKLKAVKSSNYSRMQRLSPAKTLEDVAKGANIKYDLIGIASSTGGIERLRYLISHISVNMPPIMIVQHINEMYIESMAERMQKTAPQHITVKVAEHDEIIKKNTIYFANNETHLTVQKAGDYLHIHNVKGEPLNGFIASADYLFNSMATEGTVKKHLGLILSGMGSDGAKGLLNLKSNGALTVGESQESCLVYGMPKAAAEIGALTHAVSIEEIARILNGKSI